MDASATDDHSKNQGKAVRAWAGTALAAVLLVLGAVAWQQLRYARPHRELVTSLHSVQLSVERYGVDHLRGSYPARLEDLLGTPYMLKLPDNPYGPGPLIIQQPGDSQRPGGVVYVADGPVVAGSAGAVRTDFHRYTLVGYGNRESRQVQPDYLSEWKLAAGIDWSRVAMVLFSGT